jgi:hypothetical protein
MDFFSSPLSLMLPIPTKYGEFTEGERIRIHFTPEFPNRFRFQDKSSLSYANMLAEKYPNGFKSIMECTVKWDEELCGYLPFVFLFIFYQPIDWIEHLTPP